jgi:PAS domain S-box-containing protein
VRCNRKSRAHRRRAKLAWTALPFLAASLIALPTGAQQPERREPARVLILHSYDPSYNWSAEVTLGLGSVFETLPREADLWIEYLNVRKLGRPVAWQWMDEALRQRHRHRRFDIVIACDDAAVEYLLDRGDAVLHGAPVVFCGVGNRELIRRLPRQRFTGVEEVSAASDFLDEVLKMLPSPRRLVVVTDNSPTGSEHRQFYAEIQKARPGIRFEFLDGSVLTAEDILDRLRNLDANSLVVLTHFTRDRRGNYVSPRWMAAEAARVSGAPVVSPHVRILGQGLLAGNRSAGFAHGELAGRMAAEVLEGVRPAEIPLRKQGNIRLIVDDSVAARWGVPQAAIPAGAEIVNPGGGWRALSSADRRLVAAGAVLVAVQMLLIAVLLVTMWQRRKAERELRASREMLDRAQRTARIGLWIRELRTGLVHWSEEVPRMFGVPESVRKVQFEEFLSFIHPEDRPRVEAIIRSSDSKQRSRVIEFRIVCPDGAVRHVRSVGEWTTGPRGEPLVAGMVQDITEIKHLEEMLAQVQRVEALGTLAGGVAHDFNNLLTVINGYTQMLASALPPEDPRAAYVREIRRAGERASELTRQLLAFSRRQILSPRLLDLNEVVQENVGLLRPILGDRVELKLELEPALSPVHADPVQLGQVLINLAANARDAMSAGGRLTIRTATQLIQEFSRAGEERILPGRYVELTVSDNGCGMDEDTRRRAFEPFFTTKPVGKGTGLGLASVYGIVRQSGGYITVESRKGEGTTFRILFPAAEGAIASQSAQEAGPVTRESGRILVVDDEPQLAGIIQLALRQAGYEVRVATSGAAALAQVRQSPPEWLPDLLLTELSLPELDGTELAARLREMTPSLRVLYLSHPDRVEQYGPEGPGAPVLAKPFTTSALAAAVRAALAG